MLPRHIVALLAGLAFSLQGLAQEPLRIGVADSDGPPIAVVINNTVVSGVSKDLGVLLAQQLHVEPQFIVISRKRVESFLERGKVDIVCNANPDWYDDAALLGWTHQIYPQVEKIATPRTSLEIRQIGDLSGMRIATIRGYGYPSLEAMWATGKAKRNNEDRLDLMMKALNSNLADAAIVSELEFAAWAKSYPQAASQLKIHPLIMTSVPTMCAVSPYSRFSVEALNQAIDHIHGPLATLLRSYQWHPTGP